MSRTDVVSRPSPAGSPVLWCEALGRRMRLDGLGTLGRSSQTLGEEFLTAREWAVAVDVTEYFLDEMTRINEALFTWLEVILGFRHELAGSRLDDEPNRTVTAMRGFGPGDGDLAAVFASCERKELDIDITRLELMRVRVASVHDQLVWWIQHLLADVAQQHGESAVLDVVLRTYEDLWRVRYEAWPVMSALERLQISVEGMRGHLSGRGRRGDVGVLEEDDRYTMVLDPCGSCGVLRCGDPDSGRPGCAPAGTTARHDWAWNRLGVGWYAVHSPIVMEWLQMKSDRPPLRLRSFMRWCEVGWCCLFRLRPGGGGVIRACVAAAGGHGRDVSAVAGCRLPSSGAQVGAGAGAWWGRGRSGDRG